MSLCFPAGAIALSKDFFKKIKKDSLPSAGWLALDKEFPKKIKNSLPSASCSALGKESIQVDGEILFAKCPTSGTQQRNLCRQVLCWVLFAGALPSANGASPSAPGTRQRACFL
jgi:hypothetical protein